MKTLAEDIKKVFLSYKNIPVKSVEKLPQSGGDRVYFRIRSKDASYIATYNHNIKENDTFLQFSEHFKKRNAPVPEILKVNDERTMYIQQDFGDARAQAKTTMVKIFDMLGPASELTGEFRRKLATALY